jgi:hypothetical protein
MKPNKLLILLGIICIILLPSCQNMKEGLSGQKKRSGEEFLVQKKNPLVQPDNFKKLPQPSNKKKDGIIKTGNEDSIEDIFQMNTEELNAEDSDISSLEKSILKKINKN